MKIFGIERWKGKYFIGGRLKLTNISITSDFQHGGYIPRKYTCDGKDVSPQLSWDMIPNAKSYILTMEDPDAPGGTFVHWVFYNIPYYIHTLPEAIPKVPDLGAWPLAGSGLQGTTDFGTIGYGGPCPPPGKPHRYYFRIYALDIWLRKPPGEHLVPILEAITGHVIANGELIGLYKRWYNSASNFCARVRTIKVITCMRIE